MYGIIPSAKIDALENAPPENMSSSDIKPPDVCDCKFCNWAGFKNINHKEYFAVNLSTLQKLAEAKGYAKIGIAELVEAGLTNGKELVKVLANGTLTAKVDVEANAFSKAAEEAIKAAGGNTTII